MPAWAKLCSKNAGAGSVSVRLKRISAAQSIPTSWERTPLPVIPMDGINGFASTHKHLFGMTAPQRTGPSKRTRINDGHGPSRGTTTRRHDGRA